MNGRVVAALVLGAALFAIGTIVWACVPPGSPPEEVVIVPAAPVKSLVEWWERDAFYAWNSPYHFTNKIAPPAPPTAYYLGSKSEGNLIYRRATKWNKEEWGPKAREEGYVVKWRGAGEIHVEPKGWTMDRIKADLERCEGKPVTVFEMPRSSPLP